MRMCRNLPGGAHRSSSSGLINSGVTHPPAAVQIGGHARRDSSSKALAINPRYGMLECLAVRVGALSGSPPDLQVLRPGIDV